MKKNTQSSGPAPITFPYFQIKAAGHVVDVTNKEQEAIGSLREATKPGEMWEIHANGVANLLRYTR